MEEERSETKKSKCGFIIYCNSMYGVGLKTV